MKHQKILIEKFKYLPCSVYQYEDEILYQILLLFNEHMQDSFKINIVGNDQIQINDEEPLTREVFDLNKIPLYQRDQTLIRLQKAFSDKQAEIERYEKEHPADYSSVYQQLKDDLQQLSQEIQAQRMRFLDVTLNLSRKNFPYKEDLEKFILEEQKENAYRILEAINQARQEEIQAAELMQIAIRDKAKATVEEIFQCIHICKERYSDGKLEEQVLALYDIADEWILKFGLDRSKMIEKIEVLKDNNKNLDALIYADELLLHLTKENTPVSKLALLYNLKGNLCYRMRGHWLPLAEIYYLQGIDLIKEIKSETYRLSILYSDLGIYYKELYATSEKDLEKAAVYLSKAKTAHNEALRLKKDLLDTCDPNDEKQKLQYQARYAISLNAMGDISYYQSKQQTESKKTELLEESLEIYYKKAYEIRKEILEKTKKEGKRVAARAYIVRSTINIARSYVELYIHENHSEPCHLQAADHYSQEALSIISELYQSNQSINVQIAFCGCNPYPRRYLKGNR
ncbi:MAG: hypothetical protein IJA86_00255 [Clostridia bacterium]|nr:hypothetical protein [Clostridia bacterium]